MFPNHPYRHLSSPSKKGDFQFPQVNLSFYCNLLTVADFCIPSSVLLDQIILFLWLFFCMSCFLNLFLCLLPPPGVSYIIVQMQHPNTGRGFQLRFHQCQTELSSQFLSLTDDVLDHIMMIFSCSQQP